MPDGLMRLGIPTITLRDPSGMCYSCITDSEVKFGEVLDIEIFQG